MRRNIKIFATLLILSLLVMCAPDSVCSVQHVAEGAIIACPDGTRVLVDNGVDGIDGKDATFSGLTIRRIINPCGDRPFFNDEIMLELSDGSVISSFSDNVAGMNTRFSLLGPGSYMTTDGDHCYFTVTVTGDIVNEHH